MKLSTPLMYDGNPRAAADAVVKLEKAGLDTVWVAEAYGFDSPTLMGYLAAKTETVEIGSAILNIYSRTPALLAQTAAGLDNVSGGRAILGLGASGPAGDRGLARPALRQAARPHPRGRRHRPPRDAPRGADQRRHHQAAAARGAGHRARQAAEDAHPAGARQRPDLDRRRWARRTSQGTAEYADGWLPHLYAPELADKVWGESLAQGQREALARARHRCRSPPAAWSRSARTSRGCSTSPARCSRSTSAAWAPRARTSTTTWCASTATRRRPSEIQDLYLDGKKEEAAARRARSSCSRCATSSAPSPTSRSGSPPSPSPASPTSTSYPATEDPAATIAQLKEWIS